MPAWFFASLQGYRIASLPRDLVAGLMLAAIAIPGQLATARLAGMPPETGLYAFAAGSLRGQERTRRSHGKLTIHDPRTRVDICRRRIAHPDGPTRFHSTVS